MIQCNDGYMYYATPKQHFKKNSIHEKISNTEAELKKSFAYKKACISLYYGIMTNHKDFEFPTSYLY